MSLIEQAAQRLEELRHAGVDLPESAAERANIDADSELPTPEAMIEALEQATSDVALPLVKAGRGERKARKNDGTTPSRPPARSIDINLSRLRQLGFVTPDAPTSAIADEFRVVKRPIIHNALGKSDPKVRHGNLIMVTSALPGEGKTFTSINLAMSMAMEYDSRVMLVDGDVAHPSMPAMLGTPHAPGLLDLLTRDDVDFADALIKTNVDRLTLLPAAALRRREGALAGRRLS